MTNYSPSPPPPKRSRLQRLFNYVFGYYSPSPLPTYSPSPSEVIPTEGIPEVKPTASPPEETMIIESNKLVDGLFLLDVVDSDKELLESLQKIAQYINKTLYYADKT